MADTQEFSVFQNLRDGHPEIIESDLSRDEALSKVSQMNSQENIQRGIFFTTDASPNYQKYLTRRIKDESTIQNIQSLQQSRRQRRDSNSNQVK